MAKSEEKLQSLLLKVREESEETGLKLNIQKTMIMASGSITSWQTDGEKKWIQWQILFSWAPKSLWTVTAVVGRKVMTNLDSILKSRDIICRKSPFSQSYGFSRSHVWMWVLDHKEGWALKNWYFWTMVLEKTWESLGQQEDQTSQS